MNDMNKLQRAISKIDTANGMLVMYHQIPEVKHTIGLIVEASILMGEVVEHFEDNREDTNE